MNRIKTMPLVSVIIPMQNAESLISATLASILQEREIPLEVIVINDGSIDHSLERVKAINDSRIRVIAGPEAGIAAALNAGLAEAQGEIFMRCDADDLYPSQRIRQQVTWLSQHPEFGALCGNFSTIDVRGNLIANLTTGQVAEELTEYLRQGMTRTHFGTYAVRLGILRSLGGFRPYFRTAEDIDLKLRLGEACRVWYLPELYYYYRLHENSITHMTANTQRKFFDAIALEFQQQRLAQGNDDLQRGCAPHLPSENDALPRNVQEHIQGILIGRSWREHQAGHKLRALKIGVRSVLARPSNLAAWRSLVALGIKPTRS